MSLRVPLILFIEASTPWYLGEFLEIAEGLTIGFEGEETSKGAACIPGSSRE
eukprot:CAMPEP_0202432968 /NCGR_PEP_ID=MMETSP1345-20130828/11032_1 /ASSEMBLY_ACC=CAM_ASM_000843 /TAXON_ID=342563 /ORGANISM="Fabrea Fabrea salina" /LENGTH=51 /DNA_ID=CAMNT_0049045155 /DNA_START=95 /DNA_END=250 /DNA_ORIENTATION=+